MKTLLLLIMLFLTGCATFSSEQFQASGAKASGFCIKGGYAMAGGEVVGAKVNDDFIGVVVVTQDCDVTIQSFPQPIKLPESNLRF